MSTRRPHPPSPAKQQALCDEWNAKHPIGTRVEVTRDGRSLSEVTFTRSLAQLLGGHTAVIWLDGISGAYALSRVRAIGVPA
jgi:hypothetical protein